MSGDRHLWSRLVPIRLAAAAAPAMVAWCRDSGVGRPMLVGGGSLTGTPQGLGLVHALEAAGLAVWAFDRAAVPSLAVVAEAVAGYHFEGCDAVVGIGGGAALEVAKGAALMVGQRQPYRSLAADLGGEGEPVAASGIPPLLAVPATPAAALSIGAAAWIANEAGAARPIRHPRLRPSEAILAEDLVAAVPAAVQARSGVAAALIAADAGVAVDKIDRLLSPLGALAAGLELAGPVEASSGLRRRVALTAAVCGGHDFVSVMAALAPSLGERLGQSGGLLPEVALIRAARAACTGEALADLDRLLCALGLDAALTPARRGRGRRA